MENLILRAADINDAVNKIIKDAKELAELLMQDEDFKQIVFAKDGEYEVSVIATPEGECIIETKLLI